MKEKKERIIHGVYVHPVDADADADAMQVMISSSRNSSSRRKEADKVINSEPPPSLRRPLIIKAAGYV